MNRARKLIVLELAIHTADCSWRNHDNNGHGLKYYNLAVAALDALENEEKKEQEEKTEQDLLDAMLKRETEPLWRVM